MLSNQAQTDFLKRNYRAGHDFDQCVYGTKWNLVNHGKNNRGYDGNGGYNHSAASHLSSILGAPRHQNDARTGYG